MSELVMTVIGAMAQFERDLLVERALSSLERAKAGRSLYLAGLPHWTHQNARWLRAALLKGVSVSELARRHKTSRQTIMRARAG